MRILTRSEGLTQISSKNTLFALGCCVCILFWTFYNEPNSVLHIRSKIDNFSKNTVIITPLTADLKPDGNSTSTSLKGTQDENPNTSEFSEEVQACKLPKLNPFEPIAYNAFLRSVADVAPYNCETKHTEVFHSNIYSQKIYYSQEIFENLKLTNCSYRHFTRSNTTEHELVFSSTAFNINITNNETIVPSNHEFISIECLNNSKSITHQPAYQDVHFFVTLPRVLPIKKKDDGQEKKRPNVVVLLLNSISRMTFIRAMPKTFGYLKNDLGAIELTGMTTVGDDTLSNVLAMLTNVSEKETESLTGCVPNISTPFDNCSFIWKDFKKQGYITSYGEDAEDLNTFGFYGRRGFANQPTDSYFQPLFHGIRKAKLIFDGDQCAGSKPRISLLTDYMQKVGIASNQKNRPYFQMIMSKSAYFVNANVIFQDEPIVAFLKWFQREGFLNNSIFIFMSDHGARWGKIKETPQGNIESRMPFAFFLLPKWFKEKYPLAVGNLMKNRNRFTTTFDFYASFKDILNHDKALEDNQLIERSINLDITKLIKMPRGISLFLPIPLKRTCSTAGIPAMFCTCNLNEKSEKLDVQSNLSLSAADTAVNFINSKISSVMNLCEKMKLYKIQSAKLRKDDDGTSLQSIVLRLMTQPGNATFEATLKASVEMGANNSKVIGDWQVVDGLTRMDSRSSRCLTSKSTKMYCICKNQTLNAPVQKKE